MEPERRFRVLIIAEAANPEWVSVPLVGWSLANALRSRADVHIVTQIRNRGALLRAGLEEGKDFTAIDSEVVARPVHRISEILRFGKGKGWTVGTAMAARLSYPFFERMVWKRFGAAIGAGAYDIVHRITPLTATANSSLARKCAAAGTPFVLGPLNGGVPWPAGFDAERRKENEWLSYVRGLYRFSLARRQMLASCRVIIAGSDHTAGEIPEKYHRKLARMPENGIEPTRFHRRAGQTGALPLRGCFIGRLVPYKGPDMLIDAALPHLASGRLRLDIVGNGPLEDRLRHQVSEAGLDHCVTFHGWLPHERVQDVLASANLLTFPSIREFGGGVVLEAMACGVVPIVCDYAGPAELVDDAVGYKVAVGDRAAVISEFSATLGRILDDPGALRRKSEAGIERVAKHFTWDRKAEKLLRLYRWAVNPEGPVPDLDAVPVAEAAPRRPAEPHRAPGA